MDENNFSSRRRGSSAVVGTASSTTNSPLPNSGHSHQRRSSTDTTENNDDPTSNLDADRETGSATGSSDFELDDMLSDEGLEDDEETGLTSAERTNRRRRKRRNARLDQRVASSDVHITEEEDKLATQSVIRQSLVNVTLILLWYAPVVYPRCLRSMLTWTQVSILRVDLSGKWLDVRFSGLGCMLSSHYSITNGCSRNLRSRTRRHRTKSSSRSLCSQLACTWLYSSPSRP